MNYVMIAQRHFSTTKNKEVIKLENKSTAKALVAVAGCVLIAAAIIVTKQLDALWAIILVVMAMETI